ncbi:MAG TPA: hypothetical protein VEX63_05125 [Flavisolibacter sp.]|nr:hypothetical protein [Flavisolibacter sp.]
MKKIFTILILTISLMACRSYGDSISINEKSIVYYKGHVQVAEAKKLGDFLLLQGYFNTTDKKAVQLLKKGSTYMIRFIVEENDVQADRENVLFAFEVWRDWIQEHVFPNQSVQVELVNERLKRIADVADSKQ